MLWSAVPNWDHEQELIGLWRGLLRRGLVAGRLVTGPAVRLELDWAARAMAARPGGRRLSDQLGYEQVYPGTWQGAGAPASVACDVDRRTAWLSSI